MSYKYLMSVVEASKHFNVGRDKLYSMIKSQEGVPIIKIGEITKINVPLFEQFLNKCTEEGRKL